MPVCAGEKKKDDAFVCLRCRELIVEIRGVRFSAPGFGPFAGGVHALPDPPSDVIIRKPECFPVGYHAKWMAQSRSTATTPGQAGIVRWLEKCGVEI